MKLFLIRRLKIIFSYLRLHFFFQFFTGIWMNLVYMTRLSAWIYKHRKVQNDFPSKWDYKKRYGFYITVLEAEGLFNDPVNYLEFGVAQGESMRWFTSKNKNVGSRFFGFDTFTGLPEDWGPYTKGTFDNNNEVPDIKDPRIKFSQGLFQQTVPGFLKEFSNDQRKVIMMDADLYSSTLYVLTSLAPLLKSGDIIFFDEFAVPTHEFRAYLDFVESYYIDLEMIGGANNYYFVAFRVR
ncbi:MAG: TylF/MycF/NovP-related O-methyltransferase [Flavitalea sp.]